jgi:hypothetical protein
MPIPCCGGRTVGSLSLWGVGSVSAKLRNAVMVTLTLTLNVARRLEVVLLADLRLPSLSCITISCFVLDVPLPALYVSFM